MSLPASSITSAYADLTSRLSVKWLSACAVASALLLAPSASQAQLYVHGLRDRGTNSSFGVFDLTTNTYSYIGETSVRFFDIAFDPSGTLFGVQATGDTYLINPENASTTKLATVAPALNAAAFRPTDGTLFVVGTVDSGPGNTTIGTFNQLYTLDAYSGVTNLVGQIGDYESAGDLAFDIDNNMYLSTTTGDLIRVDQSTGTPVLIGNTGFSNVYGIAYDRQARTMYGVTDASSGRNVFTINLQNGQGTLLANYDSTISVGGGSFRNESGNSVPEPSVLGLLLPVMGLTAGVVRRRKTRSN